MGRLLIAALGGLVVLALSLVGLVWLTGTLFGWSAPPALFVVAIVAALVAGIGAAAFLLDRLDDKTPPRILLAEPEPAEGARAVDSRRAVDADERATDAAPERDARPLALPSADEPSAAPREAPIAGPRDAEVRLLRELLRRTPATNGGLWLMASLGIFLLSSERNTPWSDVALLAAVILFHETGHLVAMKAFGYSDVRVFFLPFFGGAATGRRDDVAPWQSAVVSLAGPLPGILLGAVLGATGGPSARTAALMLLAVNGFNLLPFEPLDGGRFLGGLLFHRKPVLETAFAALGSVLLLVIALTGQMWILAGFAALGLVFLPGRHRLARLAAEARGVMARPTGPAWDASPDVLRELLDRVSRLHTAPDPLVERRAPLVRGLYERLALAPSPLATTVGLLVAYGVSWLVLLIAFVVAAVRSAPVGG